MTREEKIAVLRDIIDGEIIHPQVRKDVGIWAIKALEQEPCEDAISRKAVLDIIRFEDKWLLDAKEHNVDTKMAFWSLKSKISELPSVIPNRKTE